MGHYFGLAHTFRGTESTEHGVNPAYQIFYPSGSYICYHCDEEELFPSDWDACLATLISGDGICDTPMDPGRDICGHGCGPNQLPCNNLTDPNGNPYSPDKYNIMSYYHCTPEYFSNGQNARMNDVLHYHPNRSFLLDSNPDCSKMGKVNHVLFDDNDQLFEPLPDVVIETENITLSNTNSETTDIDGVYPVASDTYQGLNEDLNVKAVEVIGNIGEPLNGVTTLDLVKITKHILGIEELPKPEYWIAADVNHSGSITISDRLKIQQVILFQQDDFPTGSWQFVPEYYLSQRFDFNTNYVNNPFTAIWDDGLGSTKVYKPNNSNEISYLNEFTINKLNVDVFNNETWDFRAIKMGDVNGNALPGMEGMNNAPEVGEPVFMTIEKTIDGNEAKYDFKVEGFENIVGYQMVIDFDEIDLSYLHSLERDLVGINEDMFGSTDADQGILRTLWFDTGGGAKTLADFSSLFQTVFNGTGSFADAAVQLIAETNNQRIKHPSALQLKNFAIDKDGLIRPIIMKTDKEKPSLLSLKVSPNIFSDRVNIELKMIQKGDVEIKIFNILGQPVYQKEYSLDRGIRNLEISDLSKSVSGLLFLSVEDQKCILTKKIIRVQ